MNSYITQYQTHLDYIKQALRKNKIFLFVGAGLSLNAEKKTVQTKERFKSWPEFIEQLGGKIWPDLYENNKEEFFRRISGDHLMIAQLFEEEFGRNAFYEELLEAVPYKRYVPSAIHKRLLGKSGWTGFITTNQDCLIESTLDQLHIHYDVVIDDLDIAAKEAATKVYKVHGTMERPSSIIFTEEQYRTYEQLHPLLYVKLKAIFAEYPVVFIGFSLSDPNFKLIHGWVKDVLGTEYQRKAYAFVFEDSIDPYTRKYWEKRNIILIPMKVDAQKGKKASFFEAINQYMDYFEAEPEKKKIKNEKDGKKLLALLEQKTWSDRDVEDVSNLLARLGADFESNVEYLRDFIYGLRDSGRLSTVNESQLLKVLESVYPFVGPGFQMTNQSIVQELIQVIEGNPKMNSGDKLFQYYLEKILNYLNYSASDKIEKTIEHLIEKYENMPAQYKNEFYFILIIINKFKLNINNVSTYLQKIEQKDVNIQSLNQMGQAHVYLGEYSTALQYFNRAIQLAEQAQDDWNLFVALQSKLDVLSQNSKPSERSYRSEKKKVYENLDSLRQKLKETKNSPYEELIKYEGLRKEWVEYIEWKNRLKPNQEGFNSRKMDTYYTIYHALLFLEQHGLPPSYFSSSKYELFGEVCLENGEVVEAVRWLTYFGQTKQVEHLFQLEHLADLRKDEIQEAYRYLTNSLYQINIRLKLFQELQISSTYIKWMTVITKLLNRFIHVLTDEEMSRVAELCFDTFTELKRLKLKYDYQIQENIIKATIDVHYYLNRKEDCEKVLYFFEQCYQDFRLWGSFLSFNWKMAKNGDRDAIKDEILECFLNDSSSIGAALVYDWLDAGLLSEAQQQFIFKKIYGTNPLTSRNPLTGRDKWLEGSLLLLPFFEETLEKGQCSAIIQSAITFLRTSTSSMDERTVYQLANVVELMDESGILELMWICEDKIKQSETERSRHEFMRPFSTIGMTTAYLTFLFNGYKNNVVEMGLLREKLFAFPQWGYGVGQIIECLADEPSFKRQLVDYLSAGVLNSETRPIMSGLVGFYLKGTCKQEPLDSGGMQLLELLYMSLLDSNIETGKGALAAFTEIIRGSDSDSIAWLDIGKLITWTESYKDKHHIPYLVHLAHLYRCLKQVVTDQGLLVRIDEVVDGLKESHYSSVRVVFKG
ncbi:SIR2 family protein [Schinkia azotoformans]|uniref:SIR2 family protein n=1 Tax=Schinkia azotoformans TaxID=1454 RepID=UPI002DB66DDE|nr:SIR2 family protein [Schinkia azotoformans]MEC1719118.1 SIR2 family protein [Schinkia azotoformans]MED4413834.1 SIR2 family protein [Schinkia azotoformans]